MLCVGVNAVGIFLAIVIRQDVITAKRPVKCVKTRFQIGLRIAGFVATAIFVTGAEKRIVEHPGGTAVLEVSDIRRQAVYRFRRQIQLNGFLVWQRVDYRFRVVVADVVARLACLQGDWHEACEIKQIVIKTQHAVLIETDGGHSAIFTIHFNVHGMGSGQKTRCFSEIMVQVAR